MSAESVGQIGLDLVINKNGFDKQLSGLQNVAKKAGAALAAAFAVKGLANFAKQCIDLGSDLQEVQNVVDVTFPKMKEQVNAFARNAAASFGLSETMAKKFTGTSGAMAKAFGFSEQAAYEMATTLTGLAGDVASFYNLSQDEAYTKLKSVFTGETESLKDLGVVMTQSALDSYALANGFGKVTANMSETEKVALRYQFVQDQLSAASGDFIRTSDGWANQIRVLQLQFDSLKASIGQGLINALTPVIQVINTIIGKLVTLADYFRAFTAALFGNAGGDAVASMAGSMKSAAESAGVAASGMGKTASAAKETKKALGVAGFDELNLVSSADSSGGAGGGGVSGGSADIAPIEMGRMTLPSVDTSGVEAAAERVRSAFQKLRTFLEENKNAILSIIGGLMAGITTYFIASNWDEIVGGIIKAFSGIGTGLMSAIGGISPVALGIAAVVGLIVAAIIDLWNTSDTFRENMKRCWSIVSGAVKTAWDSIWNMGLKPLGEALAELGKTLSEFYETSGLKKLVELVITAIAAVASALGSVLITAIGAAVTIILGAITTVVTLFTELIKTLQWVFENWDSIWNAIKTSVSTIIDAIQVKISTTIERIRSGISDALAKIKLAWTDIWEGLKSKTIDIFGRLWSSLKGTINSIISGIETMVNAVVRGINKMISSLNSLSFDIPDWVPEFGGKKFGLNISSIREISIPKLAQGGFVRANTPQLAMIGDNRHHGEIVAPEDKLMELLTKAIKAGALSAFANNSGIDEDMLYLAFKRALEDVEFVAVMDSDHAFKVIRSKADAYRKRTGKAAFT